MRQAWTDASSSERRDALLGLLVVLSVWIGVAVGLPVVMG